MMRRLWLLLLALIALSSCSSRNQSTIATAGGVKKMTIQVKSAAFSEGGSIPSKYTCDGLDVSPPLNWVSVPEHTKSIALIVEDPDAPRGIWVHWILYNLPPSTRQLPERVPAEQILGNGGRNGTNDFGKIGYGGPCPPSGTHRYIFRIYALNDELTLQPGATKAQFAKALDGHVIGEGELMGKYSKK